MYFLIFLYIDSIRWYLHIHLREEEEEDDDDYNEEEEEEEEVFFLLLSLLFFLLLLFVIVLHDWLYECFLIGKDCSTYFWYSSSRQIIKTCIIHTL